MASVVMLLAPPADGEARYVAAELRRRGRTASWLDLSQFPQHVSVDARLGPDGWEGRIVTASDVIDLHDIEAIYSHHSEPFELPGGLNEPERRFAMVEARFGLGGILASLPARWVSHPSAVADAEYKPVQLAAAMRAGLTVPATWAGNLPEAARDFIGHQPEGAVYKPIMHKLLSEQGEVKSIYTTPARAEAIDGRVATTMHQFQQRVRGGQDVRALITPRGCEAVALSDAVEERLDYRDHYDTLTYARTTIDAGVVKRAQLMLADLGLRLGVFDFAVTTEKIWTYEVNPGGQWAWLSAESGAPMAELVVDELTAAP